MTKALNDARDPVRARKAERRCALADAMAISARRLPIVGPCPHRAAVVPHGSARLWCAGCQTVVHDLGAMREREVRRLLARNIGQSMCVTYRARSDGSVATKPERAPRWIASSAAVALGGCIGHLEEEELQAPEDCADAIGCADIDAFTSIPGAPESAGRNALGPDTDARGSDAVRERGLDSETIVRATESDRRALVGEGGRRARGVPEDRTEGAGDGSTLRVDVQIDTDAVLGQLVVADEWYREDGRLRFLPTRQVFSELRERLRSHRR